MMGDVNPSSPSSRTGDVGLAIRIHRTTVVVLLLIMGAELLLLLRNGQWMSAFLVTAIMGIVIAPIALRHRFPVNIPPEFQLLAIIFVFASLFLGEVRRFYDRIWWWDIALHASSGLLLGLFGFLLVYVLNEDKRIHVRLTPHFVALFAFVFAVAIGALWEIFEFGMDQFFGTTMQKPMMGDRSGLTDTMWDMIVNTLGALFVSVLGWWHMKWPQQLFIEAWIQRFIEANPRFFGSDSP